MQKKPRGLKKSRSTAKESTDKLTTADEHTAQVVIDGAEGEGQELKSLYDMACADLYNNMENAQMLFRALIHECSRILKATDDGEPCVVDMNRLRHIYGMSLFYHSQIEEDVESVGEFLSLALDNLQKVKCSEGGVSKMELNFDIARVLITAASHDHDSISENDTHNDNSKLHLTNACAHLMTSTFDSQADGSTEFDIAKFLPLASDIASFSDVLNDMESVEKVLSCFKVLAVRFETTNSKREISIDFLRSYANCLCVIANLSLDMSETVSNAPQKAHDYFSMAKSKLEQAYQADMENNKNNAELLMELCNVYLQLGNCCGELDGEEVEDADEWHRKAIEYYEKCKEVDAELFPEDFDDIIADLREELSDSAATSGR